MTLLRHVKTVPEAVFCLNLLSHIVLAGDRQTWCVGGGGIHHLSGLGQAVKDLLARFPAGDIAVSTVPLSAAALSFSLLAGCDVFFADWLVVAPLARIKRALGELGAFRGGEQQAPDDSVDVVGDDEEQSVVAASDQGFGGGEVLTGVLEAALSRWGAAIEDGVQHQSPCDAVIHRLASVVLMSPDVFFSLVFNVDSEGNEIRDGERRRKQELADALGTIIPETLEILSAALSPVVSRRSERRGDGGNEDHRTSNLACMSRVSQLASAFLRARCEQGCYAPVGGSGGGGSGGDGGGMQGYTASSAWPDSPEVSLARACGGLLQAVLHPRRGQGYGGGGDSVSRALLTLLNLFNALLVLAGGDSDLPQQGSQGLAFALRESHAALSGVLAPTAAVMERMTSWLDLAPDTLAAFLQACVLCNAVGSNRNGFCDHPSRSRLYPPSDVLREIFSLGGTGPCATVVGRAGGTSSGSCNTKSSKPHTSSSMMPRHGVRRSLLQVLAMRCVESAAQTRFFSHQQVLALQLDLQGMACDSSAAVASAAHGALQALWEAYAGFIQSADLVGQSWNPFVLECSLQNARRLLSCDPDDSVADLMRVGNEPRELRVDPPVLVSSIGRLLRWCEGKACPRLSHFKALDGGGGSSLEVLSGTAAVFVHQCAALLAASLRMALLGGGVDRRYEQHQTDGRGGSGSREGRGEGLRSCSTFHLSDALAQMVHVLMCVEPLPQEGSAAGERMRCELVDALLSLHPALLENFREATPWLEQVSMPLSSGAYVDCALNCGAFNRYEGVLFVRYDNWRALSSALESVSFAALGGKIEALVERLSDCPEAAARPEVGKDRDVHDGASMQHT